MNGSVDGEVQKQFDAIKGYLGRVVTATFVQNGKKRVAEGILESFTPPIYFQVRGYGEKYSTTALLLAPRSGVQSLVSHEGSLLYENQLIPDDFSVTDPKELDALRRKSFGEKFDKPKDDGYPKLPTSSSYNPGFSNFDLF